LRSPFFDIESGEIGLCKQDLRLVVDLGCNRQRFFVAASSAFQVAAIKKSIALKIESPGNDGVTLGILGKLQCLVEVLPSVFPASDLTQRYAITAEDLGHPSASIIEFTKCFQSVFPRFEGGAIAALVLENGRHAV